MSRFGPINPDLERRCLELAAQAATEPHRLGVGPLSEKAFQVQVIAFARRHGWKVAHFRPALVKRNGELKYETAVDADGKGFPDLVLVRERVVWPELKSESGRLTADQEKWRDWLLAAGAEWYCWRPADWDQIGRVLRG